MLDFTPRLLGLSPTARGLGTVVLAALGMVSGCGDAAPPPGGDLGPRRDFGVDLGRDLGQPEDLGPDGEVVMDAGSTDLGMVDCEVEAPDMLGSEAASVVQRIAITHFGNDFGMVFRERRNAYDDLWVRVYRDTPSGIEAGTDYAITTDSAGMSVSSVSRDPALVATASGYVAAWIDSRDGVGFEMWTRTLDGDGVPSMTLQRLTTSTGAAAHPALTRASDGTLLAGYVHDNTTMGATREAFVSTLASAGTLSGSWTRVSSADELASQLGLVPGQTSGFLSGWIDGAGAVRVRQVTLAGAPTGSAVTHGLSNNLGLDGTVLLFSRNSGFDALWAQPITAAGDAEGVLRSALTADATGLDPSVAPLSGGVVVAYRHTTTDGTFIALSLLNSRGERVHTEVLGETTTNGGPISVAVNNEGRIRLAWAEVDAGTTTTFTQAVQCAAPL